MRVHGNRRSDPPSQWEGVEATPLGGDVYWIYDQAAADVLRSILTWHWCTRRPCDPDDVEGGRWACVNVAGHDLISIEPLHLEPSLLWECCGKHGWVRAGAWVDA
jgi:hypothetical protein